MKPEFPTAALSTVKFISKTTGTLSMVCPEEVTSTNTLTSTSYCPVTKGVPYTLIPVSYTHLRAHETG